MPKMWSSSLNTLTHSGPVTPYEKILDNTGSCNGLLPDGTKPLPEPMLTYHQWGSVAYTWGCISQELFKISIHKTGSNITLLTH